MNRFYTPFLAISLAFFGAGCISVEVVKKDATPIADVAPVVEATTTSNDVPTLPSQEGTSIQLTTGVSATTSEETIPLAGDAAGKPNDIPDEMALTVSRAPDGALLTWTERYSESFAGYKIVRSETATDPQYPRDGAIVFLPARSSTTYKDSRVVAGKTYVYRVCSIETDMPVACGNAVSVAN